MLLLLKENFSHCQQTLVLVLILLLVKIRLPIIKLSYNNQGRTWTNSQGKTFSLPEQATFQPIPTGIYNPTNKVMVFDTMGKYVNQLFGWISNSENALGGMFSHQTSLQNVFSQFFNGDYSLSLVQEYYPIYQLTLPIDSQTKTRVYQLDEFADMALQYLHQIIQVIQTKHYIKLSLKIGEHLTLSIVLMEDLYKLQFHFKQN